MEKIMLEMIQFGWQARSDVMFYMNINIVYLILI